MLEKIPQDRRGGPPDRPSFNMETRELEAIAKQMDDLAGSVEKIHSSDLGRKVFPNGILDRTLRAYANELRRHHRAHMAGLGWQPVSPNPGVALVEYVVGVKWALVNRDVKPTERMRPLTDAETRSCVELCVALIRARFPNLAWKYSERHLERSLCDYRGMRSKLFDRYI